MVDGAVVVHHLRHVGVHGCLHHKNDGCHNMSNTIQYNTIPLLLSQMPSDTFETEAKCLQEEQQPKSI